MSDDFKEKASAWAKAKPLLAAAFVVGGAVVILSLLGAI